MIGSVKGRLTTRPGPRRRSLVAMFATGIALLSPFLAATGSAQSATRAPAVPRITKTALSHSVIPATGGTTMVRISVRNAKTCWFGGMSGLVISSAHQNCSSGTAQAIARIMPSDSSQVTHLHIGAWAASGASAPVTAVVYLVEAGLHPLEMTTRSLRTAAVGKHYAVQFAAKGGRAPYSWRLATGELPIGLSLSPRGMLSGTPTIPGSFAISLEIADASRPQPLTSPAQLTLTVVPARLVMTTTSLPGGAATSLYSATLNARGGVAPYTWKYVTGQLPPGLTLAPTGTLSGTPTARGTFRFGVQLTDSGQPPQTVTARVSVAVTETPIVDKTTSVPGATLLSPYTVTLNAVGGIAPYTWGISGGQLPDGVTLSTAGALAGTPTTAGSFKVLVKITDSSSIPQTLVVRYNLTVTELPLAITTENLPGATIAQPYSAALVATGGITPYSWGIASGELPPGITLSSNGTLGGTPTRSGLFAVSIKVTDSTPKPRTATVGYKLEVAPLPLLVATTALPGATVHSPYFASVAASGGTAPFTWRIVSGHLPAGITFTSAGNLAGVPTAAAGTYPITVKVTDDSPSVQSATTQLALVVGINVVNWSGYMQTGMFTSVTGTFVVPTIAPGEDGATPAAASEWVGMDGLTRANSIQAGVTEALPSTGEPYCTVSGSVCVYPWWDISPRLTSPEPIMMTVNVGDSITVTIWQISGNSWAITLDDNTSGKDFRTIESYSYKDAGSTAEYGVGFPASVPCTSTGCPPATGTKPSTSESVAALGAYSPVVPFTDLHTVGNAKSTAAVLLIQKGVQVSTPSVYTSAGFTVAYGSIVPTAP
jgi:hypothetical protein